MSHARWCLQVHKRYDPIYSDAVNRMRALGDFGFFQAYMYPLRCSLR